MAARRLVAMTLASVAAVSGLAACGGGGTSAAGGTGQPVPARPAAGSVWSDVLSQIRPDGTVSVATALEAFTLTVGPLPGMTPPSGPTGTIADGTIGVRWVIGYWNELTPAQQAAVQHYLVPAAQQAAALPIASVQLAAYRPTGAASFASGPNAGPFLAVAEHARTVIAAAMGRDTHQTISVVINATQQLNVNAEAYTSTFDSGWRFSGPAAHCVIYINPLLYHSADVSIVTSDITHEVFHCFQADDYPSPIAEGHAPDWLIEGQAEWVGDTIVPQAGSDNWWIGYLTGLNEVLFARSYDAIGFYAHMAESGNDPWHLFDTMLKASGNGAAYAAAVNDTFRDDWASSLARQPSFGQGWDTTGPSIPSVAYQPTISTVADTTVLDATVAAYTNGVVEFDPTADIVSVAVTNLHARLHASTDYQGSDLTDAKFCINNCDTCPTVSALPRLAKGPMWLAVTGDTSGASYTITGSPATCAPAPCIVGDWVSTNMTVTDSAGQQSGGAGHQLHISADGSLTAIYTGMAPIGSLQPTGTATGKVELPADPTATTGRWVVTAVNASGVSETVNTPSGPHIVPGGHFVADTSSGTWTCNGDNLTVEVHPLTITLTRKTP